MTNTPIVDVEPLMDDLKLAVAYASRIGALGDGAALEALKAADKVTGESGEPEALVLISALNQISHVIAPMTLADLRSGRDPFAPENQARSRTWQLFLSVFTLLLLIMIGFYMDSLRLEQSAVQELDDVQKMQPDLRLNYLRTMAEYEQPVSNPPNSLYLAYHQKIDELREINTKINAAYTHAVIANFKPWFPFQNELMGAILAIGEKKSAAASILEVESKQLPEKTQNLCFIDPTSADKIQLPSDSLRYPLWMKTVLADALSDYCFEVRVLSPAGDGSYLDSLGSLSLISPLKEKISVRTTWVLPFLYGLLGSSVFMMRNISSIRTPMVEWFSIIMRLSLGGVAGIVIGWFSSPSSSNIENATSLYVPFALAFLTGYGIDVLFSLLDRFNRVIGESPKN